ncbi:13537_t:CDS:1, partial [Funneliformis geosporum]
KKKDYIITKATESNEHCKETLKKFGILTIASQLLCAFVRISLKGNEKYQTFKEGDYQHLMVLSYLIPLLFAALDI